MNYDVITGAPPPPAVLTELLRAFAVALFVMASLTIGYLAQGYGSGAAAGEPISWLMFFTFGAALVAAGGAFFYFLRKRRNRDIAQNAVAK